ncbi:MAG: S-layer homology domain-containing protein [Lachnospiraceae bacterium]|nr:S-layer homology domain-containing protein [Lachnospiraceae bacterium]MDD3616664.1 S-layer homology domain-containing protein [Lachnospiraceae bacterium]
MKAKKVLALLTAVSMLAGNGVAVMADVADQQTVQKSAVEETTENAVEETTEGTTEETTGETTEETTKAADEVTEENKTEENKIEEKTDAEEAIIETASEENTVEAQDETAYDARLDAGKIILTPGVNETELNFAWYSQTKGTPAVKMGKTQDLSDAVVYTGDAADINKTTDNSAGEGMDFVASNKVTTGTGAIEENTTYYYSYAYDSSAEADEWSPVYKYESKGFDSFQTLLVGDPQLGASGGANQGSVDDQNIASDLANWTKTLEKAEEIAPNASFILSAGDQIDYSNTDNDYIRELEFAGFSTPELLRSLPLSTTIGNHESLGDDYQYHYNNPNASELGATNSGGDYYYSYGDTLFIILNSNNRNTSEHTALMNQAVESDPDAKWKVVMFHHDIYGSGAPHSDVDGANLRTLFAPLMDEFDIDVCLTGHDHSYARTYQIIDGKAINYGADSAENPDGTLYIAAGSASGSKYYALNTVQQYYIAERNNTQTPTFSTIDFTADSFTIKTYDNEGNKYAGDFTINKTEDTESMLDMVKESASVSSDAYTVPSFTKYSEAASAAADLLETEKDDVPAELTEKYDASVQGNNAADPLNYYGYAQGEYQASAEYGATKLKEGYSAFLDKTRNNEQGTIAKEDYEKVAADLSNAKSNLKEATMNFTDVKEGEFYYDSVVFVNKQDIMTGLTSENFGVNEEVSRAQFVNILYRMAGSPEVELTDKFSDVKDGDWFAAPVAWAAANKVASGYSESGLFGPADSITREQMMTMLYNYTAPEFTDKDNLGQYTDKDSIHDFAKTAISWAVEAGYLKGTSDTTLSPVDTSKRSHAAVVITRYLSEE